MREIIKNCGVTRTEMKLSPELLKIFNDDYQTLKSETAEVIKLK